MIVVDTNIVAYMVFKTSYSENVARLHITDPVWEAPILWKSEFLNVASLYLRKRIITYQEAINAIDLAEKLINNREHTVSSPIVMELIAGSTCSSYDCEFVALARNLETKLITYDKQIISDFSETALKPEDYLSKIS